MSKTEREMFDELIMAVPFTHKEARYIPKIKFALEKQIPTKGSIKYLSSYTDDPPVLLCPNCQEHIPTEGCNFYKYCYKCGQALDWSDTE